MKMKDSESKLEMLQIQMDYLKDEQRHLKSEYVWSKEEVSFFKKVLTKCFIFSNRSKEFSRSIWELETSLK